MHKQMLRTRKRAVDLSRYGTRGNGMTMKLRQQRIYVPVITIVVGLILLLGCRSNHLGKTGRHPTNSVFGDERPRDISSLVKDIQSKDWERSSKAICSLWRMIQANKGKDMTRFSPVIEPLMLMIGWGGIAREKSTMAAKILAMIGKPALPSLLAATVASESRLRWASAKILTAMRPMEPTASSALIPLISDKDPYVRRVSFECLGRLGEDAKEAIPFLKRAVNDSVPSNRMYCHRALTQITGEENPHVDHIASYLMDDEPENRRLAATLLKYYGPLAKSSCQDLLRCVRDNDVQVRINAIAALGAVGVGSKEIISGLIEALESDKHREVRRAAASSLGEIGPRARKAVPALAKILREAHAPPKSKGRRTGWWVAAHALGEIGGDEALSVLSKALKNADPDIRSSAARAIKKIKSAKAKHYGTLRSHT